MYCWFVKRAFSVGQEQNRNGIVHLGQLCRVIGIHEYCNILSLTHTPHVSSCRKDQKKVTKLEAQIPYHEGRGNKDEVTKIKEQIESIWEKTRQAALS